MSASPLPALSARPGTFSSPDIEGRPLWPHAANACLGAWIATSPVAMADHPPLLFWNDVASGGLVILLSALACRPRWEWTAWLTAGVGAWLMLAPLVLWAPTAAAYATDTLGGALIVTFAVLVAGAPGHRDVAGPDAPWGWTYNPSAWPQRSPIIALAFLQFVLARPLAAYQLGHVDSVWDPFFGDGTQQVLDSDVSKSFPISDAGFGAFTYLLEALTGFLGDTRRWRTMPWAVLLFGVMVVPVGVVSIVLVILQPLAVGYWCTLCLMTAAITVFMVSPAVDEVVATWQFLSRSRAAGRPFWKTFWQGGALEDQFAERRLPSTRSLTRELAAAMELLTIPWNLVVCALLGAWLMAAPTLLDITGIAAHADQLLGALIITFAVIGFGEASRAARFVNLFLGVGVMLVPWTVAEATPNLIANSLAVGAAVIVLSLRRGRVEERFGSWDRYVI